MESEQFPIPSFYAYRVSLLNDFNNNYRVFKFVVTPEGDLLLNACLVTEDSSFNPALVNAIIGECAKFLEVEYAGIMEHLWKESK